MAPSSPLVKPGGECSERSRLSRAAFSWVSTALT
jgi:hypothetical protein